MDFYAVAFFLKLGRTIARCLVHMRIMNLKKSIIEKIESPRRFLFTCVENIPHYLYHFNGIKLMQLLHLMKESLSVEKIVLAVQHLVMPFPYSTNLRVRQKHQKRTHKQFGNPNPKSLVCTVR